MENRSDCVFFSLIVVHGSLCDAAGRDGSVVSLHLPSREPLSCDSEELAGEWEVAGDQTGENRREKKTIPSKMGANRPETTCRHNKHPSQVEQTKCKGAVVKTVCNDAA